MKNFSIRIASVALCSGLFLALSVNSFAFEMKSLSNSWLNKQIEKHPDIVAAYESMNAEFTAAKGSKLPLYNPELSSGYEREGTENNFTFGVNQTIDLWDKQGVRTIQGNYRLTAASKHFSYTVEEKTAQALQALIRWQSAKIKAKLALEQEKQLEVLLKIVTDRQQAGDLSQIDAELTFLNLSQLLSKAAQIQAKLQQAKAQVKELLPDWVPDTQVYPKQGLGVTNFQVMPEWVSQHPRVLEAKALWNIQKSEAQYALLETHSDPTIGINAGKNNRENVVGITFSMPLNIRNDYSANAKAENQQAISAEANFRSIFRKQKFLVQANTDSLISNKNYLERWQKLMAGRGRSSAQLLQTQWNVGDLNTSDYLLALQQLAEGLYAGIELQTQFKLSEVEWLMSVGQISSATQKLH